MVSKSKCVKVWGAPGCGKTTKEMEFYQSFVNMGYTCTDITTITFRKSSANDLIEKVTSQSSANPATIHDHVGTIHSICNRLIGHKNVISPKELNTFAKNHNYMECDTVTKSQSGTDGDDSVYSGNLFDMYSWMRNTQSSVESLYMYPGFETVGMSIDELDTFVKDYEQYKKEIGKVDFTDMLQRVLDEKIPLDTPVLMVDEFQDLTTQMYKIFNMWVKDCEKVVIAGDPLQSIYGYMGGTPEHYLDFKANEVILKKSYRLPSQIWEFAKNILIYEGMETPNITAKEGYTHPIKELKWSEQMPKHSSELHLVRCNHQAQPVAMSLANAGKLYGGLYGWTAQELNIARVVIAFRSGKPLTFDDITTLTEIYPVKAFGAKCTSENLLSDLQKRLELNQSSTWFKTSLLTPKIEQSLKSSDPTSLMTRESKLFTAKINGIMDSGLNIPYTPKNSEGKYPLVVFDGKHLPARNLLTIHGAKGLEAEAAFLHTSIPIRISKSIVIPGEDSAAEARVWYVGATRAKDTLYIVKDAGKNYQLPEVATC